MKKLSILFLITLCSCAHKLTPTNQTNAPEANNSAPTLGLNVLVLEAKVDVPKDLKKHLKKKDSLLWAISDENGQVLAAGWQPRVKLPYKVQVYSQQLMHSVQAHDPIVFSTRIVHPGDEFKPPQKGQLAGTMGGAFGKIEIVVPNVSEKILNRAAKALRKNEMKNLRVGEKAEINLSVGNL